MVNVILAESLLNLAGHFSWWSSNWPHKKTITATANIKVNRAMQRGHWMKMNSKHWTLMLTHLEMTVVGYCFLLLFLLPYRCHRINDWQNKTPRLSFPSSFHPRFVCLLVCRYLCVCLLCVYSFGDFVFFVSAYTI